MTSSRPRTARSRCLPGRCSGKKTLPTSPPSCARRSASARSRRRRVASDRQHLSDERRYDVPVTVIACEFSSAMIREWMEQDHPAVRELARIRDVDYVDLPTGHWPQFTRPAELGQAILASVDPA